MKKMIEAFTEFAKNTNTNITLDKRDAAAVLFVGLGILYLITDRVLEHKEITSSGHNGLDEAIRIIDSKCNND